MFLNDAGKFSMKYWGSKHEASLRPVWLTPPPYLCEVMETQA